MEVHSWGNHSCHVGLEGSTGPPQRISTGFDPHQLNNVAEEEYRVVT